MVRRRGSTNIATDTGTIATTTTIGNRDTGRDDTETTTMMTTADTDAVTVQGAVRATGRPLRERAGRDGLLHRPEKTALVAHDHRIVPGSIANGHILHSHHVAIARRGVTETTNGKAGTTTRGHQHRLASSSRALQIRRRQRWKPSWRRCSRMQQTWTKCAPSDWLRSMRASRQSAKQTKQRALARARTVVEARLYQGSISALAIWTCQSDFSAVDAISRKSRRRINLVNLLGYGYDAGVGRIILLYAFKP